MRLLLSSLHDLDTHQVKQSACWAVQVQASRDQVASKLSLAEMQLVELQAKRLEGLQVVTPPCNCNIAEDVSKDAACIKAACNASPPRRP